MVISIKTWHFTGFISFPTLRRPQFQFMPEAHKIRFRCNRRIVSKFGGNEDAPLAIERTEMRTGIEETLKSPAAFIIGQGRHLLLYCQPFGFWVQYQAMLEKLGHDQEGIIRSIQGM